MQRKKRDPIQEKKSIETDAQIAQIEIIRQKHLNNDDK